MITYSKFWETLKKKNLTTYQLIHLHQIKSSTLDRLRHDKPVTTTTLNDLCCALDCDLSDIVEYVKDSDPSFSQSRGAAYRGN